MNFPIKIVKIDSAGGACPYQIEGETENGEYFYLRYRHGLLMAGISDKEETFTHSINSYNVVNQQLGDEYDGWPDDAKIRKAIEGKIIFPDGFIFDSGFKSGPGELFNCTE